MNLPADPVVIDLNRHIAQIERKDAHIDLVNARTAEIVRELITGPASDFEAVVIDSSAFTENDYALASAIEQRITLAAADNDEVTLREAARELGTLFLDRLKVAAKRRAEAEADEQQDEEPDDDFYH